VTPEEALSLGLSPGSRVYRFQRIRYADGEPMALEYATLPGWGLPSIEAVDNSLYEALEQSGHRPVRALQRVRAINFSEELAGLLGVEPGDPACSSNGARSCAMAARSRSRIPIIAARPMIWSRN
jgi:GntR family transcriptional regulator